MRSGRITPLGENRQPIPGDNSPVRQRAIVGVKHEATAADAVPHETYEPQVVKSVTPRSSRFSSVVACGGRRSSL
jgi:hypothetical protein